MNGRIKELEQKCWSHHVDGALVDEQLHFDTLKFAELIIWECIDAVSRTDRRHAYTTYDSGMVGGTIERSIQSIKQTFGIQT